jgi:hypothetical protein
MLERSGPLSAKLAAGLAFLAVALGLLPGGMSPERAAAVGSASATTVSIAGTDFLVNGEPTYAGTAVEGLLFNSRMVNAVFDDENPSTAGNWAYPDTGTWDPQRNTDEFVAAVPSYAAHGLRAVTVSLQGGRPMVDGAQNWKVSAFNRDGTLKAAWLTRLDQVIRACDANGIAVILSLFYKAQDQRLADEAAVLRAVDGTTDWLVARGYGNVLVEIANEVNDVGFDHAVLSAGGVDELIERVQQRSGGALQVSTSFTGGYIPPSAVIGAADFVLVHGNSQSVAGIKSMVDKIRATSAYQAHPKPIVFNEDSTDLAKMGAAVEKGASWGYHDRGANDYVQGFQSLPVNWTINTSFKRAFFDRVESLTGGGAASPALVLSPAALVFSAEEGGGATPQTLQLTADDGGTPTYSASTDAAWLYVSPSSGSAPATVTVSIDTSGLAPGTYEAAVFARAEGYLTDTARVTLTVTAAAPTEPSSGLLLSHSPQRIDPVPLDGETVEGDIYVYLTREGDVDLVRFWLDDPRADGAPDRTEFNPPWDFAGGSAELANAFDTGTVPNGTHTITAEAEFANGETETVTAPFTVANP